MCHGMREMRAVLQLVVVRRRGVIAALLLPLIVLACAGPRAGLPGAATIVDAHLWTRPDVYTVAAVERGVARDPTHWIGRTVLVRGQPVSYLLWRAPDSVVMQIGLVDSGRGNTARPLPLRWGDPDPVLAFLRRLPVVGRFAPHPQRPLWDIPAVYRLQISGNNESVLLDADLEA